MKTHNLSKTGRITQDIEWLEYLEEQGLGQERSGDMENMEPNKAKEFVRKLIEGE